MYESALTAEVLFSIASLVKIQNGQEFRSRELKNQIDSIFTYMAESISLYEISLGPLHPQTGDAYSKIAIAYLENGHF